MSEWPIHPAAISIPSDDPKVKVRVNTSVEPQVGPMSYFSSWLKMKKTVAWIMVAKRCLKSWVAKRKILELKLSETESVLLKVFLNVLIKAEEQMQAYRLDAMATFGCNSILAFVRQK